MYTEESIRKMNNRHLLSLIVLFLILTILCMTNIYNIENNKQLQLNIENVTNICEQKLSSMNQKIENIDFSLYLLELDFAEYNSEDIVESSNIIIKQTMNRWGITLTTEEIDLLAKIVYLESGNQCQDGQMAVVEVIFNRMLKYDETLEEVLSKPGQFSTWKNRDISKPTTSVYEAIFKVLYGQSDILPFKTLFFSRGSGGREIQIIIEDHVFCN